MAQHVHRRDSHDDDRDRDTSLRRGDLRGSGSFAKRGKGLFSGLGSNFGGLGGLVQGLGGLRFRCGARLRV